MTDSDVTDLQPELEQPSKPWGRRAFLGLAAVGSLGVLAGNRGSDAVRKVSGLLPDDVAAQVPGSDQHWTIFTVTDGYPTRSKTDYRLTVSGLVDRPLELDYAALLRRPTTRFTKDFQCVTGWRVRDVHWTGVLLRDLLDEAGVKSTAKALRFTSFDGAYTESLTLEQARRPDMLIAYQLDGRDLSREHGGPVRLYAAPMYGYKSIKWLDGIEVVEEIVPGYWEDRGYDVDAWVGKSNGLADDPI